MSREPASTDTFLGMAEAHFREAVAADLPPFLTHPALSTPLNATPYLVRYPVFREAVRGWPGRERLVSELEGVIRAAEQQNVTVEAILLGGSFTELGKQEIGDIDCLLFYRVALPDQSAGFAMLSAIQVGAKARGVDARFVPVDGDPLVLIKLISYFTVLYSKHKQNNEIVRCLLLLDCRG